MRFTGFFVVLLLGCEVPNPAYQSIWERDGAPTDTANGNSDVGPSRDVATQDPVVDTAVADQGDVDAGVGDENVLDANMEIPVDAEPVLDGEVMVVDANDAAADAEAPDAANASTLPELALPRELQQGLVSYWSLDETMGSVAHDPISGNDGKVENPNPEAVWTPGHRNGGAAFDRDKQWAIEVPASPSLNRITNQMSVAAWARIKPYDDIISILSRQQGDSWADQYDLAVMNQQAVFHMYDARFDRPLIAMSAAILPADVWVHLAGTYDGQTLRVYVNGKLEGEFSGNATLFADGKPLFIGDNINMGTYDRRETWNGALDEVMLYERALSGDELRALMTLQTPNR